MKVLLLQPPSRALGFGDMIRAEPLGLEAIAGNLEGHEVQIRDLRIEGREGLLEVLEAFRPRVCGISCSWTTDQPKVQRLASLIKERLPDCLLVVGGIHASLCPDSFRKPVDAVVVGEGEETFRELLQGNGDPWEIPGIFWVENPQAFRPRGFVPDLDSLPMPRRVRYPGVGYYMGFQRPLALLETSRGCPFRCTFCAVWPFYKGTFRVKSPERVVEELALVPDPFILFVDDNFMADPERCEEIARLIERRGIRKRYTLQARSDSIVKHRELLKLWKAIGLKAIFVGFEGFRDEDLRRLRKGTAVRVNDEAVEILRSLGIELWASFIVDPSFGPEDFQGLREYVRSRGIKQASFSVLTPLPGTRLFEELKERITTCDYELFDIAHAVLQTRLPLEEFYRQFCSLYGEVYSAWKLIGEGFLAWFRGFPLQGLIRMLLSAKRLSSPSFYLKAHGLSPLQARSSPERGRAA